MEHIMTKLPMPTTPVYETTLPVSKKKVQYRPFLVKEEKVLLIANETASLQQANLAIKNVVDNCTFNKLDISNIPLADVEYLFIMIRSKSIGEVINGEITCSSCGEVVEYSIDLDRIKVKQDKKVDPNIRISDDTVITMKYPSMDMADELDEKDESVDLALKVTASCVEMLTIGDTVYTTDTIEFSDVISYLENLSKKQLELISEFMESIPAVIYEDEYACPKCGGINHIRMEGVGSFFA
jgi:hypothetical protein